MFPTMSHQVEALSACMRATALHHGTGWLEQQVWEAVLHLPLVTFGGGGARPANRRRGPCHVECGKV